MNYRTGLKRSTPSKIAHRVAADRHHAIAAVLAAGAANIPDYDLTPFLPPDVFDQGQSETCWAHSLSTVIYTGVTKLGGTLFAGLPNVPPSPKQLASLGYAIPRGLATPVGSQMRVLKDEGAELDDGWKAAGFGVSPMVQTIAGRYSDVPETLGDNPPATTGAFPEPDQDALEQAATRPILGEYQIPIDSNILDVIDATAVAGFLTQSGGPVGPAFQSLQPDQEAPAEPSGGGHALALGVKRITLPDGTKKRWGINTWGGRWCQGGAFLYGSNFARALWDAWPGTIQK